MQVMKYLPVLLVGLLSLAVASCSKLIHPAFWWPLLVTLPLLFIGIYDLLQKKSTIHRNYPIIGRGRDIAHWMRPKIYQYFIESDTDGTPFNKQLRDIVYHRANDSVDTNPFGTQSDVYATGYEWMNHSIAALDPGTLAPDPRVIIGGAQCKQPYPASLLNISAMSYGSLSKNAVMALNGGAALGNFAHNTGEGGIAPYHLKFGGDLIYQLGTGYFGSRAPDGGFSPERFQEKAAIESVKMIELKLSQGAKPGHGGILPAKKLTKEIAEIRGVPLGKDVLSPPYHKAFSTPVGLLEFVQQLRELSSGKPIGIKLCIGHQAEFLSICKAIIETGIQPDYIAIDGGEGGTGAAPLEFSNSVGMPFKEGLAFAYNALEGFGIKEDIKLLASGKIITGFHIVRALSLGADACYSARGMMLALGCIQALVCNNNSCPTGIATQKAGLVSGLNVEAKRRAVAKFHKETIHSFVELMAASGIEHPDQFNRSHIYRRVEMDLTKRFDQIYPYIPKGCLLHQDSIPHDWRFDMKLASVDRFIKNQPLVKLHI